MRRFGPATRPARRRRAGAARTEASLAADGNAGRRPVDRSNIMANDNRPDKTPFTTRGNPPKPGTQNKIPEPPQDIR